MLSPTTKRRAAQWGLSLRERKRRLKRRLSPSLTRRKTLKAVALASILPDIDLDDLVDVEFGDPSLEDIESVVLVADESDLPDPSGGELHLESKTTYLFVDHVLSNHTLVQDELTFLAALAPASGGFHHLGEDTALKARDVHSVVQNVALSAPGGQVFDLESERDGAARNKDHYWTHVTIQDFLDLGTNQKIGRIKGYRVPTFKNCNLEDFAEGLDILGSSEKVFFGTCPFRNVKSVDATILNFRDGHTEIVDLANNYVKKIRQDTEVINVQSSYNIKDIFQYRGTTHDGSVSKGNILNGSVGVDQVGTKVSDSFPIGDSAVVGEIGLDSSGTVSGSGSGVTEVGLATTLESGAARTSQPEDGHLQYDAKADGTLRAVLRIGVSGDNTTFTVGIALNGSELSRSVADAATKDSNSTEAVTTQTRIELETGDTLSATIENTGGSTDLIVDSLSLSL